MKLYTYYRSTSSYRVRIALALKASAQWPDMPILMMTGYAEEKRRAHNLDTLIHDVLAKPFTLDELLAAVRAALPPQD